MSGGDVPDESAVVFFIIICLLIGGLLKSFNSYAHVPYTPMLLIAGVVITIYLSDTAI